MQACFDASTRCRISLEHLRGGNDGVLPVLIVIIVLQESARFAIRQDQMFVTNKYKFP